MRVPLQDYEMEFLAETTHVDGAAMYTAESALAAPSAEMVFAESGDPSGRKGRMHGTAVRLWYFAVCLLLTLVLLLLLADQ